jgi:hypothetical protein
MAAVAVLVRLVKKLRRVADEEFPVTKQLPEIPQQDGK